VIVDLGLPDTDGLEVIRRLREWSTLPIIVLSARGQEADKIVALDVGADDYVSKPFGAEELLARIRVALRHKAGVAREDAVFTTLTPTEYRLLTILVRHAGRVLTHRQLLKEVWGPNQTEEAHYLRVYMAQLRRKIEVDPAQPRYLLTEPGVGYRLAGE
jgi:two-component system KDP operon response regulator KdpE